MAITTWSDFIKSSNTEKRLICVAVIAQASAPGTTKTLYFSTIDGFVSGLSNHLHGKLLSVPTLTYNANELGGMPSLPSWGDITLLREDGYDISDDRTGIYFKDLDTTWLIRDRGVLVYYGGEDLPFSEYKLIFSGLCTGVERSDMTLRLNVIGNESRAYRSSVSSTQVTAAAWPNSQTNVGATIPTCIGYCWNIKPIIVDFTVGAARYIFHDTTVVAYTALLAVYEDGVTLTGGGVQYTDNLDGTFTLTYTPAGQITCAVNGAYNYPLWATCITNVLQNFAGIPAGQIDAAAVAAANTALPYTVGLCVTEETPVMEVIQMLSSSMPAWHGFDRSGVYTMRELTDPSGASIDYYVKSYVSNAAPVTILDDSLTESPHGEVIYKCLIKYYENNTPVDDDRLSGALTQAQKRLFSLPWRQNSRTDTPTLTTFPYATTMERNARVHNGLSAFYVAQKWVYLLRVLRKRIKFSIKTMDMTYNIGDCVLVEFRTELRDGSTWYRHGYQATKGIIIDIREDYNNNIVTLELWA